MRRTFNKRFVAWRLSTKARFVSRGHMIETPSSHTYPTVLIILMVAAFDGLEISSSNRTICRENIFIAGPELGSDQGKKLLHNGD